MLAGRKTGGTITGEVLLNGFPKEPKTFARIIGYVVSKERQQARLGMCLQQARSGVQVPRILLAWSLHIVLV